MNNILSLLSNIPKDNNGFEDIDKFWEITEKLNYPLDIKVKTNLFNTKALTTSTASNKPTLDNSDNEFDYDTTASITDEEEEDEFIDSDSNIDDNDGNDDDDNDDRKVGSMSFNSAAKGSKYSNKSLISIGLSPLDNTNIDESRVTSKQNDSSIISNKEVNITNQTKSSLSTSKKSLKSGSKTNSTSESITPNQQNSTFANESLSLNDSGAQHIHLNNESTTDNTPGSSTMHLLNDTTTSNSNNNTGGRSSRRVSFGANTELGGLSPIQGEAASLMNTYSNSTGRSSRARRNTAPSYFDDVYDDTPHADEEVEEDENVSRIASQSTYTPSRSTLLGHSAAVVVGDSSVKSTSYSRSYTSRGSSNSSEVLDDSRVTMTISTPGSREFTRGFQLPDDSFINTTTGGFATDNEDDELDTTLDTNNDATSRSNAATSFEESNSYLDNSYLHTISNNNEKYVEGKKAIKQTTKLQLNRLTKKHNIDDDDDEDNNDDDQSYNSAGTDEESQGLRRSSRATKGRRFAYWKGERPVYESGTMIGLLLANPTPLKPKSTKHLIKKQKVKANHKDSDDSEELEDEDDVAPTIRLPKGVKYIDRKKFTDLLVWNDSTESESSMHIVRTTESVYPAMPLPQTAQRPPGKNKVGYAAHYFNIPEVPGQVSGWISGFVSLPPQAIKDAEGVGKYAQVFFISECQDNALELGIAHPRIDEWDDNTTQRMLLRKGDSFFIPPGNIYRLENHSDTKSAMLYWTIIKPVEEESATVNTSNAVVMNNKSSYSHNSTLVESDDVKSDDI